jgi:hypothetical protein
VALGKTVTVDSYPEALTGLAFMEALEVKATVNSVEITYEGDTAWAAVSLVSDVRGTKTSEQNTFGLVKEGGQWRIDLALKKSTSTTPIPTPTPTPTPTPSATPTPASTSTPSATPLNLSLEILSVTSPVARGGQATLEARTTPGANCGITVFYKSGPSEAIGVLSPKNADAEGRVSWTWRVGANTTPGDYKIEVTAEKDGGQATATRNFTVVE